MRFGVFDHVDRSDRPLAQQLDERLKFVAAADDAGFYEYHCAEHHATPLGLASSPSVYLAAVARATRRMRLGSMVYLVPMYRPLRLIEEICMLDHLSHGRLDVGVGRGVSASEQMFRAGDANLAREMFSEAMAAVVYGLTHERLTYSGRHFTYENVPMELRPLQQPHPPFWYPTSNLDGARYAGDRGYHFCALGAPQAVAPLARAYRDALKARGGPEIPNAEFADGAACGVWRQLVVADTEKDALEIAAECYERWLAASKGDVGGALRPTGHVSASMEAARAQGALIAGTPDTVRAAIARQIKETGVTYMAFSCFFGAMSLEAALRTIRLFARDVRPHFA